MPGLDNSETNNNEYRKLGINLFYIYGWFNNFFSSKLKKFGLTTQQFNILRILKRYQPNPVSLNVIQDCMPDKQSDVSRLIERMRAKGLVERQTCPIDRRKVDITLKSKGLKLINKVESEELAWVKEFFSIEEDKVKKLNELLEKFKR